MIPPMLTVNDSENTNVITEIVINDKKEKL